MKANLQSFLITALLLAAVLFPLNYFLKQTYDPKIPTRGKIDNKKRLVEYDLDGNGAADLLTYDPSAALATWKTYLLSGVEGSQKVVANAPNTFAAWRFGRRSGLPVPGDYNHDGLIDLAVYYAGRDLSWSGTKLNWEIEFAQATSEVEDHFLTGYNEKLNILWGFGAGLPVPGDYDGDGATDIAIYFPLSYPIATNQWHFLFSGQGFRGAKAQAQDRGYGEIIVWGPPADKKGLAPEILPVSGDYNGDGRDDATLWVVANNSQGASWYIYSLPYGDEKKGQSKIVAFGDYGDIPVPGDYNCDQRTEIAVYRPATGKWLIRLGKTEKNEIDWTIKDGEPFAADFDGDGCADPAFYSKAGESYQVHILNSSFTELGRKIFKDGSPAVTRVNLSQSGELPVQLALRRAYLELQK